MTPTRVVSVCVGISKYAPTLLREGERPLAHLAASAESLNALFCRMWPNTDGSRHVVLTDEAATYARVSEILKGIEARRELVILYLGGHGRRTDGSFQFLFHCDKNDGARADTPSLDALLEGLDSRCTLVLLDACYAGQYAQTSIWLRKVSSGSVRLCLSSSMPDQKSWEDAHFGLSLFAHALVDALTTSGPDARDPLTKRRIRVSGELFDSVSNAVAKHAFALKASVAQEPLLTGSLAESLYLPMVMRPVDHATEMTVFEVLVRRSRQIAVSAVAVACALMAATSWTTWRPAINASGSVELRAGPKWLSPLNVGSWSRRIELPLTLEDLNPDAQEQARNELGTHVWPGRNNGTSRWADVFVTDMLADETAARWRVLLGLDGAVDKLVNTRSPGGGPMRLRVTEDTVAAFNTATLLAAESKLLEPNASIATVWKAQWRQELSAGGCDGQEASGSAERSLLPWVRGLATAAQATDEIGFEQVEQLVKMFAGLRTAEYAAASIKSSSPHVFNRPTPDEIAALASLIEAIVASRTADGRQPISPSQRASLLALMRGNCEDIVVHVVAGLGVLGDPGAVSAWSQKVGFAASKTALRRLAMHNALPADASIRAMEAIDLVDAERGQPDDFRGRLPTYFSDLNSWLVALGDAQPLSKAALEKLLSQSTALMAAGANDAARELVRVAARSPGIAKGSFALQTRVALDAGLFKRPPLPSNESELEVFGLLARSGFPLLDSERSQVLSVLDEHERTGGAVVHFSQDDRRPEASPTSTLSAGMGLTHAMAFARAVIGAGATSSLAKNPSTTDLLHKVLRDAVAFGVRRPVLEELAAATAIAGSASSPAQSPAEQIASEICGAEDNASRSAARLTATARLALLDSRDRAAAIGSLRTLWRIEQAAECKLALAETVIAGIVEVGAWSPVVRPGRPAPAE